MRLFSVFLFCFGAFFARAQDTKYQALFLDKKLTENANAVVRLDEMTIEVASQDKMTYKVRQVVTVLNKRGDRYATTHVFYDKEKKVSGLEAYVYDKLGREIEHIKSRDFEDVNAADGFSLYLDDKLLQYRYTPTEYPYTLEFFYEVETADTGVFPPWYFLSGSNVSVERSRYSISYASENLKPVIREQHISGFAIEKKEAERSITYSAKNLRAMEGESLFPGFKDVVPNLAVRLPKFHYKGYNAKADDWKELGAWIDGYLLAGRTTLPEATKARMRNLVAGIDDDLEEAKIIYRYVQENTRYISVQIGIGGFQPIRAIEVDLVKYGDCKGLSNYTKALLEAVGVTSYYTVVQAGRDKVDFEESFSDLRQGNHAILAIPYKEKYYWIDCTSKIHPFGFLGDFTDDRKVLVVKPDGGEIVKTVAYLDEQNHRGTHATYSLSEDGSISGAISITSKGIQYDNRFLIKDYSDEDLVKYYKRYWGYVNNLQVRSHVLKNNRDSVVFKENLEISASNYASRAGDRILVTVNAFDRSTSVPKRYRNRKYPFEIQRGHFEEDEFTIHLPEGYQVETLPDEMLLETEFGRYSIKFVHDALAGTVKYRRSLLVRHGLYPRELYAAYRNFRKNIAGADNAQMVLVKNRSNN